MLLEDLASPQPFKPIAMTIDMIQIIVLSAGEQTTQCSLK